MRFIFLILFFTSPHSWALRIPATLYQGQFVSAQGFQINSLNTSWVMAPTPSEVKSNVEAFYRIKPSGNSHPTFTVRVDSETPYKNLNDYAQKWLKSYGQFGVEVLGHKYFKTSEDNRGLVIDILNSSKKARQVVFFRNQKAVVLTCMDHKDTFNKTIKACNDMIKSFTWVEENLKNPESPLSN